MSVKVTEDHLTEVHTHSRSIAFEGVTPQIVTAYGHQGKLWVPDYAHARWDHGEPINHISVSGHVLKKDGTPGISRTSTRYMTPASKLWDSPHYANTPEWLLALFADSPHTIPEGASK